MPQVPDTLTPVAPLALVTAVEGAYLRQLGHYPTRATLSILCAQVALETRNGQRVVCNNPGNYKRGPGPDWCVFETFEDIGDPPVRTTMRCEFSAWPSLAEGVAFWLAAFGSHWTEAWAGAVAGDAGAFCAGLKRRGYYTCSEASYEAGVRVWASRYLVLLDGGPCPVAEPDEPWPASVGGNTLPEPEVLDADSPNYPAA